MDKFFESRSASGQCSSGSADRLPLLRLAVAVLLSVVAVPVRAAPPITAAAFSPDGRQVVLGSQAGLEIRSWPELHAVRTLPTKLVNIHDLRFSPRGRTLLAAGGSPAESGDVEVWTWSNEPAVSRQLKTHDDVIYRVAWSPDATQWASAGGDGICQVYSAESWDRVSRYEGHSRAVLSLDWLRDGSIVSVGVDQSLRLWESARPRHVRTLDNHVGIVNGVALRPATDSAAPPIVATISDDRTVRLWQPTIGRLVRFARLPSAPRTLVWSKAGDQLLVGCNDGKVRLLDADTVVVLETREALDGRIHELLIEPGGRRILVCGETGCRAIELAK